MKLSCGCRVFDEYKDAGFIVYCPLHAAAPDLLEVCKAARRKLHMALYVATVRLYDTRSEREAATNDHVTIKALDAAIAKAEAKNGA